MLSHCLPAMLSLVPNWWSFPFKKCTTPTEIQKWTECLLWKTLPFGLPHVFGYGTLKGGFPYLSIALWRGRSSKSNKYILHSYGFGLWSEALTDNARRNAPIRSIVLSSYFTWVDDSNVFVWITSVLESIWNILICNWNRKATGSLENADDISTNRFNRTVFHSSVLIQRNKREFRTKNFNLQTKASIANRCPKTFFCENDKSYLNLHCCSVSIQNLKLTDSQCQVSSSLNSKRMSEKRKS